MQRPRARHSDPCASCAPDRTTTTQSEATGRARFERGHSRSARSLSSSFALLISPLLLLLFTTATGWAADPSREDAHAAKSLDEQVQEIKSDVLAIAAELSNLEERLLYPSNTQIAVFVAVAEGDQVDIDSARLSVDGELVAQHIYTWKELQALQKGGVQRIYTGNVPTGSHQLEVTVSGKRSAGKDFELLERFSFEKQVDPKLIGITLGDGIAGATTIAIEDW